MQLWWNFESERPCSLEIDDELEFGGLFDRDIAGLRPAQNLVDQLRSTPQDIRVAWSAGHESPGLDKIAAVEHRREPCAERKRDDARAIGVNAAGYAPVTPYCSRSVFASSVRPSVSSTLAVTRALSFVQA
jgi:hypothetical protein